MSHQQYVFLMQLQRSIKDLQQTLQQDLEEMSSKRDRKDPSHRPADHQPFTVCLGLLLKSAEVSLLLKPIPPPEGTGSPLGSELSPSESRGTLEPAGDAREGGEKGNEGSGSEGGGAKQPCTVDQLLYGDGLEGGPTQVPAPLVPTLTARPDLNHKASAEERTPAKSTGRGSSDESGEVLVDGISGGDEMGAGLDSKTQPGEPLPDPLGSKDWSDKDKAAKMPQSISRYSVCLADAAELHNRVITNTLRQNCADSTFTFRRDKPVISFCLYGSVSQICRGGITLPRSQIHAVEVVHY